jgi:Family of unknown function (DUF6247)
MTAQPVEDPSDPLVILRDLPERERDEFLRQYRAAVDAAHDPAGYEQLRRLLHLWSLAVVATNQPGYYDEIATVRARTSPTTPIADIVPDWSERLAAARDPLRTFPTSDPYVRRAEFGGAGLVTYLIDDGAETVTVLDVTWAG